MTLTGERISMRLPFLAVWAVVKIVLRLEPLHSDILPLTEPPLPDPTPTPSNTPRLASSRPKRTELDRNGPKLPVA